MTATMTAGSEDRGVPAGEGFCGRTGCGRPLPAGQRGRSRRFCSEECRRRHYNALRGKPAPAVPVPEDGPGATLGKLSQLLAEASRLAATASAQAAETDSARVAAMLAEAEASRRSAEAHAATAAAQSLAAAAQTAESAESAAVAWEAADAADAARPGRRTRPHGRTTRRRTGTPANRYTATRTPRLQGHERRTTCRRLAPCRCARGCLLLAHLGSSGGARASF